MSPDFLAIGPVTRDLTPNGYSVGGAVTFGALTALRMGLRPAIVTSAGPNSDIDAIGPEIPVHVVHSAESTTFRNIYERRTRKQVLESVAAPITPPDVPQRWRSAPMVLLGPLAGEVSYELARYFPKSLVVASIQGWLRQWDDQGRVTPKAWEAREVMPHVDAAVVSIEDVEDCRLIDLWAETTPVLIVTMGSDGARLHSGGRWHQIPPFAVREVDPTGAGDVFAAAYLVGMHETGDDLQSARFASCAASFCVEADGTGGIPTRAQVEDRLRAAGA